MKECVPNDWGKGVLSGSQRKVLSLIVINGESSFFSQHMGRSSASCYCSSCKTHWKKHCGRNKLGFAMNSHAANKSSHCAISSKSASNSNCPWPSTSLTAEKHLTVCLEIHCGTSPEVMASPLIQEPLPELQLLCEDRQWHH